MSDAPMDGDRAKAAAYVAQATGLPLVQIAFNQAITHTTPTEISAVLRFGQRPLALLIMSPVMAKTFAKSLLERVAEYEGMSGSTVKTIEEMSSNLRSG